MDQVEESRRLQWLGHIRRMGPERKLKQTVFEMFKVRREGDLMMDAPATSSWRELTEFACDKTYWSTRVRSMRQPRVRVEFNVEEEGAEFAISMCSSAQVGQQQ